MDVREKLVELLESARYWGSNTSEEIAENLISNGVTVQEWIPVTERLPDKQMKCLVYTERGDYGGYDISYYNQGFYSQYAKVTHWMPLPELPKEGAENG